MVHLVKHDLEFILKQIKLAEGHSAAINQSSDIDASRQILADMVGSYGGAGLNPTQAQIMPFGLRTVSGVLNNLMPGMEYTGAADQIMPRLLTPNFLNDQDLDVYRNITNTNYGLIGQNVADADPRIISNLISDQTLGNPATIISALVANGHDDPYAVLAVPANYASYSQALTAYQEAQLAARELANANAARQMLDFGPAASPQAIADADARIAAAETDLAAKNALKATAYAALEDVLGVTMEGDTVVIPNVASDLGDTAPFNGFFTLFGQFFDHGLDLVSKGGAGNVYIPLSPDDPLYVVGGQTNFMVLTRATPVRGPGADGVLNTADDTIDHNNETTPWIDLNQVYTSNPSHQVFLREYSFSVDSDGDGILDSRPVATGHMLESATGGPPTWADVKQQAAEKLGILLVDADVLRVPAILTDLYGEFVRGANGLPQIVTASGPQEGNLSAPVAASQAFSAGRAFLNDIAHSAVPAGLVDHDRNPNTPAVAVVADADGDIGNAQPLNMFGIATTYDDELLNAHVIVGDGRGNENIGLTSVHHVFHHEHNRQVDEIKNTILATGDLAFINEWLAVDITALPAPGSESALVWDGERLFQAGRFSTEMVYQHLVFEEFARAVAPDVDPFLFSNTADVDAAIVAEFAHVVYRFGHSMLTDTIDIQKLGETGIETSSVGLIEAFLNPVAFNAQGEDASAAAGAILRGMSKQVGNEIDEYLTDALRNNLVGLPLDLGALNITRARETGVPSLNQARSQFYTDTQDTRVKPYDSWYDFALALKNPASLINFIAAYGTHTTVLTAATLVEKRDAAAALVLGGDDAPADRLDFLHATGNWAASYNGANDPDPNGTLGGLNLVDFWIGGLAEKKMTFGSMLGSTFTYVFEYQMEQLQAGDRFYYLSRTQGLNLLNELEADSFAQLVMRNTVIGEEGGHINGAAFQTADYVLEMDPTRQLTGLGVDGRADPNHSNPILQAISPMVIRRDLDGDGDNDLLRYTGTDHVVLGGTSERDVLIGGEGDDTLWGGAGDDDLEGGYGVDHLHGGDGDDLITDSGTDIGAADVIHGDAGNDVINPGSGLDLVFGGSGQDFIYGGSEAKTISGGLGNDFIRGGTGINMLAGNEGDDWLEGGESFDTLAGENSELFFNSTIIGHDVLNGRGNDTDYDAESGDDIMVQGPGIQRNNGMAGFDWAIHKGDTQGADSDMNISIFTNQQANILRDRFDLVEGLSGWNHGDRLTGRDVVIGAYDANGNATQVTPDAPFDSYSNALLAKNVGLIDGLAELVAHLTPTLARDANGNVLKDAAGQDALVVMDTSDASDILLGGGGSDIIRGMGGNDIIDGDKWLNVRIQFTHGGVNYTTDGLGDQVWLASDYVDGAPLANAIAQFGGKTLDQLMFSRTVNPGALNIVREIVDGGREGDIDTAVYWDDFANYSIVRNTDGSITISHVNPTVGAVDPTTGKNLEADGTDRLWNIERLQFADRTISLTPPAVALDGFNTTTSTAADNFNTRAGNNNNGTVNFTAAWAEAGDGQNTVITGNIQIDQNDSNQLRFNAGTADGATVTRTLDLSGVNAATVTFSVGDQNIGAGDDERLEFQFAADGQNFVTLATFDGNNGGNQSITLPTNVAFTANAAIRFRMVGSPDSGFLGVGAERFEVDTLVVTATKTQVLDPAIRDIASTFTEGQAAISVGSEPLVTDDGTVIAFARVVLTNALAGDVLTFGALPAGISGAVANDGGAIIVTLSGAATPAAYQAAIQAVTYRNLSENPAATPRVITVTVNDGAFDSDPATHTITVVPVNDVPVAGDDAIRTNINGTFTLPDWVLLANDVDADGNPLAITGAASTGGAGFTVGHANGATATTINYTSNNGRNFNYTVSDAQASDTGAVSVTRSIAGTGGNDIIVADNAASTINGGGGNDIIFSGGGNDVVTGGAGDDIFVWNVGDGRDRFDGGANATAAGDLARIEGNATDEAFVVYSRAAALQAGITGLNGATEIVITRNGAVIAELDNVEEILINTGAGNDTVTAIGNFNPTSLNFNTITINGSEGNDTVDISALSSAHRILFRTLGGNDVIVGNLRAQDVIELPAGSNPASYSEINNGNGTRTLTNGSHSITFTGQTPGLVTEGENSDGGSAPQTFTLTARDIAGLTNLVRGLPAFAGDDDTEGATGVRTLSGAGNNADNSGYGAADTTFIRLTEARYGDGVVTDADGNAINRAINPIFDGIDPRALSQILGAQEANLPTSAVNANMLFMAFGQYFDHGLDFIPKGGAGTIVIDGVDVPGPVALNYSDLTRATLASPLTSATDIPRHINKTSAFVDQNQAYGSNETVGQFLRESDGNGGHGARLLMGADDPTTPGFQLLSTLRELLDYHREAGTRFTGTGLPAAGVTLDAYYPTLWNGTAYDTATVKALAGNFLNSGHALLLDANPFISLLDHYVAGDGRANENVALTSVHTIWARNHNFHIDQLEAAGFNGTPEEQFQAAKMLNEAEYQRVVFTEFADMLIGGIQGDGDHGFDGYNPDATASISHEFAAAVYRIGHSLIGDTLTVKGENGQNYSINLFDAFLNPSNDVFSPAQLAQLQAMGYNPQPGYEQLGTGAILGGIVEQPAEEVDFNIVDAVRNDLVRIRADLFAFNVARGWDVGLGTLNQIKADLRDSTDPYVKFAVDFLKANGGSIDPYADWQDFQTRNGLSDTVIAQFRQAYPDLVLSADKIAAFRAINGDIVTVRPDGSGLVKGIDRVDLWVGGLAEKHFNGGMAGETFWVVLHEQFDRLQEADRFYYLERFDNFDLYEDFIDGQEFADIIARNTGLTNLPENVFSADLEDGVDEDGGTGDDDEDGDDDEASGGTGNGNDDDDDEEDEDGEDDEAENDEDGDDDGDDAGAGNGSGNGNGQGTGGGTTPLPVAARTLVGTTAAEALIGAAAADIILAGAGNDVLTGEDGDDILHGEDGDDVLTGGNGADVLSGGAGDDELHGGEGADFLFGDAGNDRIFGDAGNDVIEAGAGSDQVWAGAGDDVILATRNDGDDTYWGGEGNDTLDYSVATSNLTVNLGTGFMGRGSVTGGDTGSDIHYGFENFIGGAGHDLITASSAVNIIDGGAGNDTFRFTSVANVNGDRIYGFQPGDKIDFAAIDANTGLAGVQSFTLKAGAISAAGDIVATHEVIDGEAFTVVRGNVDGDPDADFELLIAGTHNLRTSDFNGVS